jgi:hypothetical protein
MGGQYAMGLAIPPIFRSELLWRSPQLSPTGGSGQPFDAYCDRGLHVTGERTLV